MIKPWISLQFFCVNSPSPHFPVIFKSCSQTVNVWYVYLHLANLYGTYIIIFTIDWSSYVWGWRLLFFGRLWSNIKNNHVRASSRRRMTVWILNKVWRNPLIKSWQVALKKGKQRCGFKDVFVYPGFLGKMIQFNGCIFFQWFFNHQPLTRIPLVAIIFRSSKEVFLTLGGWDFRINGPVCSSVHTDYINHWCLYQTLNVFFCPIVWYFFKLETRFKYHMLCSTLDIQTPPEKVLGPQKHT